MALDELSSHKNNPLQRSDFPTESEITAWNDRTAILEAVVKEKTAVRAAAQNELSEVSVRHSDAVRAFDAAQFSERMTRLPEKQIPKGVGELSAVR